MNNPTKRGFLKFLATGAALLLGLQSAWAQVKVACVGDSITVLEDVEAATHDLTV